MAGSLLGSTWRYPVSAPPCAPPPERAQHYGPRMTTAAVVGVRDDVEDAAMRPLSHPHPARDNLLSFRRRREHPPGDGVQEHLAGGLAHPQFDLVQLEVGREPSFRERLRCLDRALARPRPPPEADGLHRSSRDAPVSSLQQDAVEAGRDGGGGQFEDPVQPAAGARLLADRDLPLGPERPPAKRAGGVCPLGVSGRESQDPPSSSKVWSEGQAL